MKKKKAKLPMSGDDEKLIGELIAGIKKTDIGKKYTVTDGVETEADVKYWISTTCWPLDKILGGGLPLGRIVEIYGPDGCGKSTLGLAILSQAQKEKNVTIMNDTENSYDSYRGTSAHNIIGEKLLYSEITSIEETFSMFEKIVNEMKKLDPDKKVFFLWDSVAATSTLSELEGMYGDDYYGIHARKMSQGFRKIRKGSNATLLLINQIRQKMGTYHPTYTTFGGWAVKFYPSIRLKMKVIEKIKSPGKDEYSGIKVEMFTKKNKVYPPFKKCNIIIDFKRGVDNVASCVDYFIEKDIIKKGKKENKKTGDAKELKGYYFLNEKNMRKIEMIKYFRENEDEMRELFFKKGDKIEE